MKLSKILILSFFLLSLFPSQVNSSMDCLKGNCYNGHGTKKYKSGNIYTGTFKNGYRDGQGIFAFANGEKYIGEFKRGKRNGIGAYFFNDGSKYEGEYVDDVRTGFGIYTLPNGARYEGEYRNGQKNGQGKFIFPDGQVLNGAWENGDFVEPETGSDDDCADDQSFALTISPFPGDAKIRFLNSSLKYEPRMKLAAGRYKLEISHPRYKTKIEYVDILKKDLVVPVTLRLKDRPLPKTASRKSAAGHDNTGSGKRLTRGMEFGVPGETFDSRLVKAHQGDVDQEILNLNRQKVETAMLESENAQQLSMIEQLRQELEMLKSSIKDPKKIEPKLVSIKKLSGPKTKYKRIALVVGNSQYPLIGELRNPEHDARDIAEALRKLGFSVIVKLNVDQQEMEEAIAEFGQQLTKDSVGLFYYAGHGVQMNGSNYLIPVQSGIRQAKDIRYKGVDLNMLIDEMVYAENNKNVIILDACRNNPLPQEGRQRASIGLARTDAPAGTLIAYATSPGSVAFDGEGRNGIYTKYLLENMFTPGVPIEIVFKRVLQGVASDTDRKQIPWMSSSLEIDFYFTPGT